MILTHSEYVKYNFIGCVPRKIFPVEWISFCVAYDQNQCIIMMMYSEIVVNNFYACDKKNMKNLDHIQIRAIYD